MSKRKSASFKETVVTEYLAGGTDHRTLAAKYNISHSVIDYWIKAYQGIKTKSNAKAREPKKAKVPEFLCRQVCTCLFYLNVTICDPAL